MTMAYRRGFKAEAERLAADVRAELALGMYRRLDPLHLAEHLDIPVWTFSDLVSEGNSPDGIGEAVDRLHRAERSVLSAFTVFSGSRRVVVHNDAHAPGRQASNIMHELSHGLLLHPPSLVFDQRGCRDWKTDLEDEANYLAGALLIPAKAAWWTAKQRQTLADAADIYGCSIDMVRWRVNITGAHRLLA